MAREDPARLGAVLAEVATLLERGEIRPLPTRVYAAANVADAFREMAQGHHSGKLVVTIADGSLTPVDHDAVDAARGGTVVVTGGFGAIGRRMAGWLVDRGVDRLALIGRHPDAPTARGVVDELRGRGATVLAVGVDVARRDNLQAALARIRRDAGPITGVIHAAGVLADATLMGQTETGWRTVFDGKARGASWLDEFTSTNPLAVFIMTSSVASFIGLSGQANYAAANAWLDALAARRRHQGRPALSLGWGPWAGGGLASGTSRAERLAWKGLGRLTSDDARRGFDRALALGRAHVAIMNLDPDVWIDAAGPSALPVVLSLQTPGSAPDAAGTAPPAPDAGRPDIGVWLRGTPPGPARRQILEGWLREHIGRVLRLAPERIDVARPFRMLGLDSLMGLELRHRLERSAGVPVPVTAIWNHPTVGQFATYLAERLGVTLDQRPPADSTAQPPPADDLDRLVADLEAMSDDDAARLAGGDQ